LKLALFEGYGLDDAMVDSLPPSVVEDEIYAVDEGYLSDCCRFITLLMSMTLISGGEHELDVEVGIELRVDRLIVLTLRCLCS